MTVDNAAFDQRTTHSDSNPDYVTPNFEYATDDAGNPTGGPVYADMPVVLSGATPSPDYVTPNLDFNSNPATNGAPAPPLASASHTYEQRPSSSVGGPPRVALYDAAPGDNAASSPRSIGRTQGRAGAATTMTGGTSASEVYAGFATGDCAPDATYATMPTSAALAAGGNGAQVVAGYDEIANAADRATRLSKTAPPTRAPSTAPHQPTPPAATPPSTPRCSRARTAAALASPSRTLSTPT